MRKAYSLRTFDYHQRSIILFCLKTLKSKQNRKNKKMEVGYMSRKIIVLDTTLRDGEQVPGAKLNLVEKLEMAQQLKKLNVDIIEAGFPSSSEGDFNSVKEIAKAVGDGPMITALARAVKKDIDSVYQSVKYAQNPLIHIVLGTSDVHVEKKFSKSKEQVMDIGVEAVKYAKTLCSQVQYSTEDASRSEFEYLWKTIEAVVKAGATMINIPDTVGYAVPEEFGTLISKINYRLKILDPKVILSVHCHNDMGLATANTLAAVKNGADKVECTVNGLGERAGNAALEEVVMSIFQRKEYYNAYTDITTTQIYKTSKLLCALTGLDVQVNKALTGDNAFAHSSGIHQDGLLKSRDVYEVISPETVGVENMEMVLTARSGRHAFKDTVSKLGFVFDEEGFETLFSAFLELADSKKEVYLQDVYYLIEKFQIIDRKKRVSKKSISSHTQSNNSSEFAELEKEKNDSSKFTELGNKTKYSSNFDVIEVETKDSSNFDVIEDETNISSKIYEIENKSNDGDLKKIELYEIVNFQVVTNDIIPTATVKLKKGNNYTTQSSVGDGPIDALYSAIKNATGMEIELKEYKINSLSRGKEALGRINIKVLYDGKTYTSRATETDIIKASGVAFVNAINNILLSTNHASTSID